MYALGTKVKQIGYRYMFEALWWLSLAAVPLLRFGEALDAHWSFSWMVLAVLLAVGFLLNFISCSPHVLLLFAAWGLLIVIQYFSGCSYYNEDLLLAIFLAVILAARPVGSLRSSKYGILAITALWILFTVVLGLLLWVNILREGYTHEITYLVKPLFAHRNIAVESYTLWTAALIALLANSGWRWLIFAVSFTLIVIYQVRTALLSLVLLAAIESWIQFIRYAWFKWLLGAGIVALATIQILFLFLHQPAYKHRFDALPDLVKNFDIPYNLSRAESSSDRLIMWRWTINHTDWLGKGPGSWKFEAEGYVNQALGKCDLVVRHPHADVLKVAFEMGWLGLIAWLAWLMIFIRPHMRYFIVFIPMFLFAFPTERAETLSALLVMILCTAEPVQSAKLHKIAVVTCFSVLFFSTLMWNRSQNAFGRAMRDPLTLRKASTPDRAAMNAFPFDIVLNRLPTYQAIVLADAGETQAAIELLHGILKQHPNDRGAIRLMERLGGALPPNTFLCTASP